MQDHCGPVNLVQNQLPFELSRLNSHVIMQMLMGTDMSGLLDLRHGLNLSQLRPAAPRLCDCGP